MKKKLIVCIMCVLIIMPFLVSCGEIKPNNSEGIQIADFAELNGTTADLLGATGIGLREREQNAETVALYSLGNKDAQYFDVAKDGEESEQVIKDTEFVKQSDGRYDEIKFLHNESGENGFTLSEKGMQVTKLYSVGGMTFMALGVVTGDSAPYVKLVSEIVMNTSYGMATVYPRGDSMHFFADVNYEIDGKSYRGYVPCRTYGSDYFYDIFNYWNDDLNASFVIDNATGRIFNLGDLLPKPSYISSVENGVLQMNNGEYYDVVIDDNGIRLNKIDVSVDAGIPYTTVLKDKFGNFLFDTISNFPVKSEQKEGNVIKVKRERDDDNLLLRDCYRMGTDNRLYKFEISLYERGQEQAKGIFVLDENAEWQPVEKSVNTKIPYRWIMDHFYMMGSPWMRAPRYSSIENGQLVITNGFAGEFEFTRWEGDFPSVNHNNIFYGAAAFSSENPVAHTAKGPVAFETDSRAFPDCYIMSGTKWFSLENGTLFKNDVFEEESVVVAENVTDVEWDIKGILTVYIGETEKYILCDISGGVLSDDIPMIPQRECILFVNL